MVSRLIELVNKRTAMCKWFDEYLDKWSATMDEFPTHECFAVYHEKLAEYSKIEAEILTIQASGKLKEMV